MPVRDQQSLDKLKDIFSQIPHCNALGMEITDLTPGKAAVRLEYTQNIVADPKTGQVHGGVISTVMDTVAGMAAISAVSEDTPVATLDLRIDYLARADSGKTIIGEAECYKLARNVAFVRGIAHHGDSDTPIAHVVAVFMMNATGFTTTGEDTPKGEPC